MKTHFQIIQEVYTRKVSGETFEYELRYTPGETVKWQACIYHHGEIKGKPSGSIIDNVLSGEALQQFVVSYVEGIIERGIGLEE